MTLYTCGKKYKGTPFQIDDEDFERVSKYDWFIGSEGYPVSSRVGSSLHVFLMGPAPLGKQWDHENRNKLDNRKENLRSVTDTVNKHNRDPRKDSSLGISGICIQLNGLYLSRIGYQGKMINLGLFKTLEEAKQARKDGEDKYWKQVDENCI